MDIKGRVDPGRLGEVAVYRRIIGAGIERIWENVLDWEHLPWLHASSFSAVELLESRRDGWRARVWLRSAERAAESIVETHLDFARRRYLTLTCGGIGAGTEIWTELEEQGDETAIEVRFLVPDVPVEHRDGVGRAYLHLYATLWDEDEQMMRHRQAALAGRTRRARPAPDVLSLGRLEDLRDRLPIVVEFRGRPYRVVEVDGELAVHSTICPHLLGPLDDAAVEEGCVRCPWHGYRFDLRSRRCQEVPRLALARAPELVVDARTRIVSLAAPRNTSAKIPSAR